MNYDTREGIQAALDNGLAGLNELIQERARAGYQRRERMDQWVIMGLLAMDTCGNTGTIDPATAPHFRRHMLREELLPVMSYAEYQQRHPECWLSVRHGHRPVPSPGDVCDSCGRGWTLENVHDWAPGDVPRHASCHRYVVIENARHFFAGIFFEVCVAQLQTIPNEYYRSDESTPWFIARTWKGPIKIGWRKRVINIDWSQSEIDRDGTKLFADENVTKGPGFIHAWGRAKCVEYLQKLFYSKG